MVLPAVQPRVEPGTLPLHAAAVVPFSVTLMLLQDSHSPEPHMRHPPQAIVPEYAATPAGLALAAATSTAGHATRDLAEALLQHYAKGEQPCTLGSGRRLAYSYRAEQKMVLWGAVLASAKVLQAEYGAAEAAN